MRTNIVQKHLALSELVRYYEGILHYVCLVLCTDEEAVIPWFVVQHIVRVAEIDIIAVKRFWAQYRVCRWRKVKLNWVHCKPRLQGVCVN